METTGKELKNMIDSIRNYSKELEPAPHAVGTMLENLLNQNYELTIQLEMMYKIFLLLLLDTGNYEFSMKYADLMNLDDYDFTLITSDFEPDKPLEENEVTFRINYLKPSGQIEE